MSQILHGDIPTEGSTLHTHDKKTPASVVTTEAKSNHGQRQHGSIRPAAEEEPKAPISSNRWTALKSCLPVLAPIPATIAIITLQFVNVYISAEYQSQDFNIGNRHVHISELQNALQLPASIYGLLITTSVSAIALHRIRYELAEREGVALGYLLAGYQLNHLPTLLSKAFWTGSYARARGGTRLQHLSLLILVGLCIFLAHFGQSMGAMLIVPKPAWWLVRHLDNTEIDAFIANKTEIYPQHLTQSTLPDGSCLSSTALQNDSCPAGGYFTLLETLPNWNAEYLAENLGMWNITFFNDDASREVVSFPLLINNSSYDSSLTSSPQQVFVRAVADYFQWQHNWKLTLKSANNKPLLMPLVQVQCAAISSLSSAIQFPYSNLIYPPLSLLPNTTNWTLYASEFAANSGKPVQFSWADLSGFSPGPSLGAVVRLSKNLTIPDGFTTTPLSNDSVLACTIDARWAPVQLYLQPYVDGTVRPDNAYADGTTPLAQIEIDPSWAESLNLPVPGSQLTTMETIIQDLVYKDLESTASSDPVTFLSDLAVSLGSTITDGLARIGWQEHFAFTQTETNSLQLITVSENGTVLSNNTYSDAQTADWMHLEWKVEHYGYGFSAATITAKVAMVVLLLHAALAIGHTVVVCLPRKVWCCDSWGTIGSLVVLAMNSRPDERLLNMSAGIKLKQSWQEIVKIREFGEENLELIVAEDSVIGEAWMGKEGEKLKPGKKYGTDLGN